MPTIQASSHCCGIYEMQGVHFDHPTDGLINQIIQKTRWNGVTCKMVQFSDTPGGNGDLWWAALIEKGYQVDKFDLGLNPKTGNRIFLYHWYLTPIWPSKKAMKISIVREYTYEQEQQRQDSRESKPGAIEGKGVFRDRLGRFVRRSG